MSDAYTSLSILQKRVVLSMWSVVMLDFANSPCDIQAQLPVGLGARPLTKSSTLKPIVPGCDLLGEALSDELERCRALRLARQLAPNQQS